MQQRATGFTSRTLAAVLHEVRLLSRQLCQDACGTSRYTIHGGDRGSAAVLTTVTHSTGREALAKGQGSRQNPKEQTP